MKRSSLDRDEAAKGEQRNAAANSCPVEKFTFVMHLGSIMDRS